MLSLLKLSAAAKTSMGTRLAAGRYNGVVRLAGSVATNGPEDLLVLLEVTGPSPMMSPEEMLGALIEGARSAGLEQSVMLLAALRCRA